MKKSVDRKGGHGYNKFCSLDNTNEKRKKNKAWRGIEVVITRRS